MFRGLLVLLAAAGLTVAAAVFAPIWLPLIKDGDEPLIAYERAQRRLRAAWSLPMPGEPNLARFPQRLAEHGVTLGAAVFIRIFKREFELEVWLKRDDVFHRFETYPICRWSGELGPKLRQGDRQAPEGFYTVDRQALNPNSRWFRSFNLGFPNAYDRSFKRTGSFLMVHGGCGSVGCYAMTNSQMAEIWKLLTAAIDGGQKRVQVQVLPFRLADQSLGRVKDHPSFGFWQNLKQGSDLFEANLLPPRVSVCKGRYVFKAGLPGDIGDGSIDDNCAANTASR